MNKEERKKHDKKYYETHKEQKKEYQKKYYESHKEEMREYHREYMREYYETHKEEMNKNWNKYYKKNRDKLTKRYKKYNEKNNSKILERKSKYRKNNHEVVILGNRISRYYSYNYHRYISLENYLTIMKLEDFLLKRSIMIKLGHGIILEDEAVALSGMIWSEEDQKELDDYWKRRGTIKRPSSKC